ncbi:MAG: glycosyltransferase family 2 protein [Candidatus Omnitrophota bacterium]|nr:glycosyltransferase family 2 protein [Candidatus Omnitrophota bacterium]
MNDLVSIIIPTYNRAGSLARAIESCIRQRYANIEIIIIDDFSSDGTPQAAADLALKDARVRSVRHDTNRGVSAALNTGIKNSRGLFLTFMDDDCELLPDAITHELSVFSSLPETVRMVFGNIWIESVGNRAIYPINQKDRLIGEREILKGPYWLAGYIAWFGRRSLFTENIFDEKLRLHMDMDLLLRVLFKGEKIFFHNKCLRINHEMQGISTLSPEKLEVKEAFLAKHLIALGAYKKYLARLYYCLGKDSRNVGDSGRARKYFWEALKTRPLNFRYFLKAISS